MHFGKSHLEDKREDLRSHYGKIEKTAGVTALRIAFCLLLVVLVCGAGLVIGAVRGVIDSAPDISEANIMPLGNASFIYDADGNSHNPSAEHHSGERRRPPGMGAGRGGGGRGATGPAHRRRDGVVVRQPRGDRPALPGGAAPAAGRRGMTGARRRAGAGGHQPGWRSTWCGAGIGQPLAPPTSAMALLVSK
mgnify:CR=1 FL=1